MRPVSDTRYKDVIFTEGTIEPLPREEEAELFRQYRTGDQEARDRLIMANLRFVFTVAAKFQNVSPMTLPELVSEGRMGLLRALESYDSKLGYRFISYAVWWIKQAIISAITQASAAYRVPNTQIQDQLLFTKTRQRLEQEEGGLSYAQILEACNLTKERKRNLYEYLLRPVSLDAPLDSDGPAPQYPQLPSPQEASLDELLDRHLLLEQLKDALRCLTPDERYIIRLHFGFDSHRPQTVSEISRCMGRTRERIRQLRNRALDKLRKNLKLQSYRY